MSFVIIDREIAGKEILYYEGLEGQDLEFLEGY